MIPITTDRSFKFSIEGNGSLFGQLMDLVLYASRHTARPPTEEEARSILTLCANGVLSTNHPDAIAAADVIGFEAALLHLSKQEPKYNAMRHRLPGSFGTPQ